ncbi:unnamed protein product [Pelagomonas calceolata]|uniref:Uncharacterized protein n=1 Tax=Pelagomonas calceolata TaxID=35677 RepID=A0A8J2SB45_9STRA|nr:unnamed protein product [Pelagomonas calceolata]
MAALTTRAEQALRHDAAATETAKLLRARPTVVARSAGPRSGLAALASATASATEDLVVIVTATPRRTAREVEARLRTQRDVLIATDATPELVDSAFWGRLFAPTEDAAVHQARELAGGVRVRAANDRRVVVCAPSWLRRELLSGRPLYFDQEKASAAAYCFDVDVVADPVAADCCTVLRAAQSSIRLVLFNEGEGPHASACAAWLGTSLASVGASHQRRLWCWPPGQDAPLRLRIGAEDDAWPRALALARRGIDVGGSVREATVKAVAHLLVNHATVKVVATRLDVADALSCDSDEEAIRRFVRRCDPSSKKDKASAATWLRRAQFGVGVVRDAWSRDASVLALGAGLVKVVVCNVTDRVSSAACVVAEPIKIDRAAYAALAEGTECDIVQVLDGVDDEAWRAACVDGNAIASSQKVFPRPRLSAALLLRAASTLDAERQLSLVTTGLASCLSKFASSIEDGLDDERDERQACDERAMLILRRPAHAMPWLKKGRVGRCDASRWCCVVGLVAARHGSTNDAKRPVEVVLEEAPRWNVRRVPASSIRLTGVVVTLAEDLSRPGNVDACRRATLEALEALQRKDSKKKKKRRVALFLDELDVIEVKDEADAASYRSLTARAAVLKRRDGDELSEGARSELLKRVYAREFRRACRLQKKSDKAAKRSVKALRKLGLAQKNGEATPAASVALACVARFGGDDRAALVAALACFPVDGTASPLRALAPRLLSEALAALACPLTDASEAFVAGVEAYDPTAHADDRRAFAAARAAVEAAARSVGRACGDDALVAEELAVLSARPRAGLPSPVDLLHALAAGADAASDAVFAGRLREAAVVVGGFGGVY